jgi:hypothetical protein
MCFPSIHLEGLKQSTRSSRRLKKLHDLLDIDITMDRFEHWPHDLTQVGQGQLGLLGWQPGSSTFSAAGGVRAKHCTILLCSSIVVQSPETSVMVLAISLVCAPVCGEWSLCGINTSQGGIAGLVLHVRAVYVLEHFLPLANRC